MYCRCVQIFDVPLCLLFNQSIQTSYVVIKTGVMQMSHHYTRRGHTLTKQITGLSLTSQIVNDNWTTKVPTDKMSVVNSKNGRTHSESSFDDGEGEDLDPRVKSELEKLNAATDGINHLETELNEAQLLFNEMMEDASKQLKVMHQKIGKCVDKSRPYYEALKSAKTARTKLHEASLTYEMSQTRHFNAKKRVIEVEKKASESVDGKLDPTLQELMNQVTTEVMDAAIAYEEAEKVHHIINEDFNTKHIKLQQIHNNLKTLVAKSRPFFELKSNLNRKLEIQRQRVVKIQEGIHLSKRAYSETLAQLQIISDEIHRTRDLKRQFHASAITENLSNDTQNSNFDIMRNLSLDQSEISIDEDTKSVDSVSGDDSSWEHGLTVDDTCSTTSSVDIEYNLLQSKASMDNNYELYKNTNLSKLEETQVKKDSLIHDDLSIQTNQSNVNNEQTNQSNLNNKQIKIPVDTNELSGIVINVNDAMQEMQGGQTSPFTCITSHVLEYTMPSSFHSDTIDSKTKYIQFPKSHSFTDLLRSSLTTVSMTDIEKSRNRCKSLPNLFNMDYSQFDEISIQYPLEL